MQRYRAWWILVLVGGLLLGNLAVQPGVVRAAEQCFPETGFCVQGRFLDYWQTHGGLMVNGYPLSAERRELLEDGNEYLVQYFERVRLEYHPENQPPHEVLLGQLGRRSFYEIFQYSYLLVGGCSGPRPERIPFPDTPCTISSDFLDYWQTHGGLTRFGYPISEELTLRYADGSGEYQAQYFERARIEYHPQNQPPYNWLLGQFGREIMRSQDLLAGDRPLHRLFLQEQLYQAMGTPREAAQQTQGAFLPFERGAMLYRADSHEIIVFEGHAEGVYRIALDTWRPGDDPGGGPGPTAGLYQPGLGFGKLWRNSPDTQRALGYATAPDEMVYTVRVQRFARGVLITATTPGGKVVYRLVTEQFPGFFQYSEPQP